MNAKQIAIVGMDKAGIENALALVKHKSFEGY
jgi:uncharacterized NAD(P)/FAD-binding protein YdhS